MKAYNHYLGRAGRPNLGSLSPFAELNERYKNLNSHFVRPQKPAEVRMSVDKPPIVPPLNLHQLGKAKRYRNNQPQYHPGVMSSTVQQDSFLPLQTHTSSTAHSRPIVLRSSQVKFIDKTPKYVAGCRSSLEEPRARLTWASIPSRSSISQLKHQDQQSAHFDAGLSFLEQGDLKEHSLESIEPPVVLNTKSLKQIPFKQKRKRIVASSLPHSPLDFLPHSVVSPEPSIVESPVQYGRLNQLPSPLDIQSISIPTPAVVRELAKRAQKQDPVNFKIAKLRNRLSQLSPQAPPSGLGTWNGDRSFMASPLEASLAISNPRYSKASEKKVPSPRQSIPNSGRRQSRMASLRATDYKRQSEINSEKRAQRDLMMSLNRQVEKLERLQSQNIKQVMMKKYKIKLSDKMVFFKRPEDLQKILEAKAHKRKVNEAVTKIQRWFRFLKSRANLVRKLKKLIESVQTLKKVSKSWAIKARSRRQSRCEKVNAAVTIQSSLRGYLDRQSCLKAVNQMKTEALHEHFSRIDQIMKGHLQRMIRRAWLNYKQNRKQGLRVPDLLKKRGQNMRSRTLQVPAVLRPVRQQSAQQRRKQLVMEIEDEDEN